MVCFSAPRSLAVFILLVAMGCAGSAVGGDVQIEAFVASGPREPPLDILPPDTEKLYVLFKTHGVTRGDKFRAALIADRAGRIAPNSKITEATATLDGDTIDGGVSFSRPTNGWLPGDYHVDIYINNQLTTTARFAIGIAK